MPIILIFLIGTCGVGASYALTNLMGKDPQPNLDPTTRFYAINESEIVFGKPAYYRILVENREVSNVDYELKVRLSGHEIYNQEIKLNSNDSLNRVITLNPNITGNYQKLEFLLYKDNEIYRTRVFQIFPTVNYSLAPKLTAAPQEVLEPYTKQQNGNIIVYKFKSGEKLELKVSNDTVDKGNGLYTTSAIGNNIIFMGENYEKVVLPNRANYLYPVIMDEKNRKIKINETLPLKNGYVVTIKQIDNQSLKLKISKNNKTVRDITSSGNSSIEYWEEEDINDYRKQKVIQINPRKINRSEVVFDIIQYGSKNILVPGNRYGEFQVTNITENSITMKNNQPIKLEAGKVVSLMGGKMKIKV